MLLFLVVIALAQAPAPVPTPNVAVVDVSASDAVYEDVSRALADEVVEALRRAGAHASRVDEREVPDGCRFGPCLGEVAKAQKAHVIVALDAVELDSKRTGVGITALWGYDGRPLAAQRYVAAGGKVKPAKAVTGFAAEVTKAATALMVPPAPRAKAAGEQAGATAKEK